jgi:hypothetical protein
VSVLCDSGAAGWDTLCKAASFGAANDKRRENYALGVWLSASPVISLSALCCFSPPTALSLERLARALQFAAAASVFGDKTDDAARADASWTLSSLACAGIGNYVGGGAAQFVFMALLAILFDVHH